MRYSLMPEYKKSTLELQFFHKDNKRITVETWWRWATFEIEADAPPVITEDTELYSTFDNLEFVESGDGDVQYYFDGMSDEEIAEMEAFLEAMRIKDLAIQGNSSVRSRGIGARGGP